MPAEPGDHRRQRLETALIRAADWLVDCAQIRIATAPFDDPQHYPHHSYIGAMRTEYDTRTARWSINGPVFHTGQAVRSLLVAYRRTGDTRYLDGALLGGEFLLGQRIDEPGHPQRGLLLSLEQNDDEINLQVTLEAISGLLDLFEAFGDERYLELATTSVDIMLRDAWLPDERLILDHYSLRQRAFIHDPDNDLPGRAMLDDAVLSRLTDLTGIPRYREVFLQMADRILEVEGPAGTWLVFPPWRPAEGRIHNRKSWWWGWPFLAAHASSGSDRYLAAALRAGDWYRRTQNLDGGLYYSPGPDGTHNSFGVCSSVSAVAAILWADLYAATGDPAWLPPIGLAIGWLLAAQFAPEVDDPNLPGAIWEAPNFPDGSLAPGFQVRDLGAIFGIRAFDRALSLPDLPEPDRTWATTRMAW